MESFWSDLGLNLISEGLGILVTIGVIDQMLKRQEARKWKPAKDLLFATLLEIIVNELLFWIVPGELQQLGRKKLHFGNAVANVNFLFQSKNSQALNQIKVSLSSNVSASHEIISDGIVNIQLQIDYMLRFSSFILDAELFMKLLKLNEILANYKKLQPQLESIDTKEEQYFLNLMTDLVVIGAEIQDWLVDNADLVK